MRRLVLVAVVVGLAAWLAWPGAPGDLRRFDPDAVAEAETAMWRSYYERNQPLLFVQLAALLCKQYGQRTPQAVRTAFHAARAAVVFQRGHSRPDYQQALPDLITFYRRILPPGGPAERAAELELEWWIAHRERSPLLEQRLAELQGAIYGMPAGAFYEHATRRAEAMRLRDQHGDWVRISELLRQSWRALHSAVR